MVKAGIRSISAGLIQNLDIKRRYHIPSFQKRCVNKSENSRKNKSFTENRPLIFIPHP